MNTPLSAHKVILGAALLLLNIAPAHADSILDAGIRAYQNRDYGGATSKFQECCSANQNNDVAHYYLALCHQALRRRTQAREEYEWVATNSKNPALVRNASIGLQNLGKSGGPSSGGNTQESHVSANSYFFTQINDPKWNRKAAEQTLNCGPTCLAMAFKRFNKFPPNFNGRDPEYLIQATRMLMTGGTDDVKTTCAQIKNGALAGGLNARLTDGLEAIDAALDKGEMVIAVGNPFISGSYGPRIGYESFKDGHFILVTGKSGGYYIVNDPYFVQGPVNLSSGELTSFMKLYAGQYKGNCVAIGP